MKKFLSLLTACIALTSCSNIGSNSLPANDSLSSEADNTSQSESLSAIPNGYKAQEIDMPLQYEEIYEFRTFPDSKQIYIKCDFCNNLTDFRTGYVEMKNTENASNDFSEFNFEPPDEFYSADFASCDILFKNDRSFFTLTTFEDHGGMRLPEVFDDFFDYDAYNANFTYSYTLNNYNNSGELLSSVPLEIPENAYEKYFIYNSIADEDSILVSTDNGKIFRISENGEMKQIFTFEGDPVNINPPLFRRDRDGRIIVCISGEIPDNNGNMSQSVGLCDIGDDDSIGEPFFIEEDLIDATVLSQGSGEYRMYIPRVDGLYGITDTGEDKRIINYEDVGIESGMTISIDENVYLSVVRGQNNSKTKLYKIVPRTPEESTDLTEITISCPDGYLPRELMNGFNNSQNVYKIKSEEYTRSDEEISSYSYENNDLNLAILSGNAPDIICGLSFTTYQNFQHKGVFTNLYPLMENDPDINRRTLLPNVLKAMETSDGSLYSIFGEFEVNSMVAKTKVWNKESWTLDEMLELYDNPPVNAVHRYDGFNKGEMFNQMSYCMDELIDYETTTCNFQSDEFIKMLEFCNRFVDTVPMPDKAIDGEAAHQNYYADRRTWLAQDAILNQSISLGFPLDYSMTKYLEGGGQDLTIVGYPSSNGKGGRISAGRLLSITESSDCKEGAWAFISYYIKHCHDDDPYNMYGDGALPLIADEFEDFMDYTMHANRTAGGNEIPNYSQEDRDMIADYIKSCDTLGTDFDEDIRAVCVEESGLYFAGQQTAEQTAEHIQNRVSIIISEKN